MYDVIFNMYCNIKSCIVFNKCKSDYFACDNGVRQGENLSLFLFSLFLNENQRMRSTFVSFYILEFPKKIVRCTNNR
jgi:hypothetical protein